MMKMDKNSYSGNREASPNFAKSYARLRSIPLPDTHVMAMSIGLLP
jgi:hypothetical protein